MKKYKWIIIIVSSILIICASIISIMYFIKNKNDDTTITIGINGNWYINNVDTNVSSYNIGNSKTQILTGNGKPESRKGHNIYVDLDSLDFYLYIDDAWELRGNIKEKPQEIAYESGLELHLLEDGTYGVYKCTNEEVSDLIIPSHHNKRAITKLMEKCLFSCSQLTHLELPNTINEVENDALNLTNLEYNEYNGCKYIGNQENPYLVLIDSSNIMYIQDNTKVLYLTTIIFKFKSEPVIAENNKWFKTIDGNLFNKNRLIKYNRTNLDKIYTIPTGVTSIGEYAFYDCDKLTSVIIPHTVTNISDCAFYNCSNLENITIPYSVSNIGDNAFYYCDNLETVEIRNGVKSIGNHAFSNCEKLETIIIPSSITYIGQNAFNKCDKLDTVFYNGSLTDWCNILFSSASSNPMAYAKHFNINNSKGQYSELHGLIIPDGVTYIGNYQFYGFDNISNIIIPSSVKNIQDYAFSNCEKLEYIVMENSVKSIGEYAFSRCKNLISLYIPNSITHIGNHAFIWSDNLEKIYYKGTVEDWCNISFSSETSNPMYYASSFYLNDRYDQYYELTEVVIPNKFSMIGKYQFFGFDNITSIEIPNSVLSIGEGAFSKCTNLMNLEIPNSVTIIGDSAFSGCDSLTTIILPDGITSIGNLLFHSCESLANIEIPDSVTSIGNTVFSGCSSLTSIVIPNSVTSIGNTAFNNCSSLTSIVIPDSVTSIGDYAFNNCTSLTIYCEIASQPDSWSNDWNPSDRPVVWNYNE